jgi:3',5'-cyclic AMP phosphodiesterase CpdA
VRTIVHLSDLHFGRTDDAVVAALPADIEAMQPTLVAVSGDLTQRARRSQFEAAARFLERLPAPRIVVPGNHDVPLYDVGRRFMAPLDRFRRFISDDLAPTFVDDELAVLGLNTARSATWKNGRVSLEQMVALREWFSSVGEGRLKVLVAHHPFLPPPADPREPLVGRGLAALEAAQGGGVDLLLGGHLHVGYSADVMAHFPVLRRAMVVVQAASATSTRRRGEPNSYNVVRAEPDRFAVEVRTWAGDGFRPAAELRFERAADGWRQTSR